MLSLFLGARCWSGCFNEAEARAPRMQRRVAGEHQTLGASMRPRRARLGCFDWLRWMLRVVRASMRPMRARFGLIEALSATCNTVSTGPHTRRARLGLIEARLCVRGTVGTLSIRGARASASLKHLWGLSWDVTGALHPRRARLGLIEALSRRTLCASRLRASEARAPRPH